MESLTTVKVEDFPFSTYAKEHFQGVCVWARFLQQMWVFSFAFEVNYFIARQPAKKSDSKSFIKRSYNV